MTTDLHPFANPGRTKLALVSRGVALPEGLPQASRFVAQANAVESVLDLRLPTGQFCSVPVGLPFTEHSGFALRVDVEGSAELVCGGERQRVELVPAPRFYRRRTRTGARMGSFAALHDRLLILHPWMGCGFFAEAGKACRYCQYETMFTEPEPRLRDPLELVEVVRAALAEREVDTVYLYNGFSPSPDAGLARLAPVIALLRKHLGGRQIALETVAPRDLSVIDELYAAGLDIFICNLEVFDSDRFSELCPGKQESGGQEAVWRALRHARSVFRAGSVVSHLIVGLEPLDSTIEGMKRLVAEGVVPLLVPFRPLPGTPLADHPLPSLDDLEQALLVQYELLSDSGLPLHRLRDMGRVLTPMESRALVGGSTALQQRWQEHRAGRAVQGWLDRLRRILRLKRDASGDLRIERGPILPILLRRSAPFLALLAILGLFAAGLQAAPPDGLRPEAWNAALVFALCLVLWVSQLLPMPVTSVLGLSLLPMTGVMPATSVFSMFGSPAVFFILGAFILSAGILRTGLAEQLALQVLERVAHRPLALALAMLWLPALLACVMPEHAVVAVLLPIAVAIAQGLGLERGHPFARALFFALAWGAVIGGVTTLLGGARGPLAMAILSETTGASFDFLGWMAASVPVVLPMLFAASLLVFRLARRSVPDGRGARSRIHQRRLELGRMDGAAWMMALLMLLTVAAWISAGEALGLASIALLSVTAMFALRITGWREVQEHVDWGVVLMYGGAIAVAKALQETGAAAWMAEALWPAGLAGWPGLALLALATLLLTEAVSNAAAVAIMLPLALSMAPAAGWEAQTAALAVGIVSGFAFMLPMGTPANAMVLASGYVEARSMLRLGLILMLCAWASFALATRWCWGLL